LFFFQFKICQTKLKQPQETVTYMHNTSLQFESVCKSWIFYNVQLSNGCTYY